MQYVINYLEKERIRIVNKISRKRESKINASRMDVLHGKRVELEEAIKEIHEAKIPPLERASEEELSRFVIFVFDSFNGPGGGNVSAGKIARDYLGTEPKKG